MPSAGGVWQTYDETQEELRAAVGPAYSGDLDAPVAGNSARKLMAPTAQRGKRICAHAVSPRCSSSKSLITRAIRGKITWIESRDLSDGPITSKYGGEERVSPMALGRATSMPVMTARGTAENVFCSNHFDMTPAA
jgi:hypothetical protein